tara:strand:- start:390 stop:1103 length:714 start_codon:yes stop_codon:yes gene_type:complete
MQFILTEDISFNIERRSLRHIKCFSHRSKEQQYRGEMVTFLKLCSGKSCFIDIGAFHGVFALAFISKNPNASAYAIEPSPQSFNVLHINIELNPSYKITPFKFALGASDDKIKMKGRHQFIPIGNKEDAPEQYTEVDIIKLDNFVSNNNIIPDIIKIDTEGYEYDVLMGGKEFLKEYKPIISLEVHIPWLNNHGITSEQLVELIYSMGYKIYDLEDNLISSPELFLEEKSFCNVFVK